MHVKNLLRYLPDYKQIGLICFSALCITLLTSFFGFVFQKLLGHDTAFSQARDLLYHYPKSSTAILAFSAACFILLAITFIDVGSKPMAWLQKNVIWPSMHILSHMLCLSIGVFWAWAITESINMRRFVIFSRPTFANLVAITFGSLLFITVSHFSESFFSDSDNPHLNNLGTAKPFFMAAVGLIILAIFMPDFIYNFTSQITQQH